MENIKDTKFTEKSLFSIKEVFWSIAVATAFVLQTSRLENKLEQYIAINNADKKIIDLQITTLQKQDFIHSQDISEIRKAITNIYATKPEEPKIIKKIK